MGMDAELQTPDSTHNTAGEAGLDNTKQSGATAAAESDQTDYSVEEFPVAEIEGVPEEEISLVHELEQQLQESRDKHLRLLAEFDNYKRRNAKERIELRKTAAEDLIVDLLGVLDDFHRAKTVLEANPGAMKESEGFLLIAGKLRHVLEQRELKAMESLGTDFDPERHEAITDIPAPTEAQKGKVLDVVEEGYMLGEKIIRYAKVVVGK